MRYIKEFSFFQKVLKCLFIGLALFSFATVLPAQIEGDSVAEAFENADAETLSGFFQPELWLCIKDFEDSIGSRDAAIRLDRFFTDHTIKGFERLHNGGSANHANEVLIGKLYTNKGDYRVYVYFSGGAFKKIDELRIEP
mgnify:CR=1 FL=1